MDHPVRIMNLVAVLSGDQRLKKGDVKTLRMYSTSLTWRSLLTADLGTKIKHTDLKPSAGKKPPKPKVAEPAPAADPPMRLREPPELPAVCPVRSERSPLVPCWLAPVCTDNVPLIPVSVCAVAKLSAPPVVPEPPEIEIDPPASLELSPAVKTTSPAEF